jgi:hypothetical protein
MILNVYTDRLGIKHLTHSEAVARKGEDVGSDQDVNDADNKEDAKKTANDYGAIGIDLIVGDMEVPGK